MSFIYTAFGDKIYIENFTETINTPPIDSEPTKTTPTQESSDMNNEENDNEEVSKTIDFNVYSHIRIYNADYSNYITLYPKYFKEYQKIGGFGLFTKKGRARKESFLTNEPFKTLNSEANLVKLKILKEGVEESENNTKDDMIINPNLGIFHIDNNQVRQKQENRNLFLVYDFENKKLETIEQVDESKNNMIKFNIVKKVDGKDEKTNMVNNYIFFDWSPSGSTRLNIYDNQDNNGNELLGSFYKINKDRDTFYLANISNPDVKEKNDDGSVSNHYIQVGKNSYFDKENASMFAYKPILSPDEINKSININVSNELIERFKFHNSKGENKTLFMESMNINTLVKVKTAMDKEEDTDLTPEEEKYKKVIKAMKNDIDKKDSTEKSKNLYDEMITLISETIIIRDSFKYYLVQVTKSNDKRTSQKIKYITFENSNYLSNNNVSKHLKVWVRESV